MHMRTPRPCADTHTHTQTHTPLCGYRLSTGLTEGLGSWWLRNRYSLPSRQPTTTTDAVYSIIIILLGAPDKRIVAQHMDSGSRQRWKWVIFRDPWPMWPIQRWRPNWPMTHWPISISGPRHCANTFNFSASEMRLLTFSLLNYLLTLWNCGILSYAVQ